MSAIQTWFGGFAWGAVFGIVGATTAGIVLFRPDIVERITMERPAAPAGQAVASAPPAPARPPELRPAPAAATSVAPKPATPPTAQLPVAGQAAPGPAAKSPPFIINSRTTAALEQAFTPPRAFARNDELVVRGRNMNAEPVDFNLRIDDAKSSNWNSRYNRTDTVAPGPFEVRVPFDGITTSGKAELDINAIVRIVVFSQKGVLDIDSVQIETQKAAPTAGQSWLRGAKTTAEQEFSPALSVAANQGFILSGTNPSDKPLTVNLRVDDAASMDWNSRAQTSLSVPPGPFVLRAPAASWITPAKTLLDRTNIRRVVVFVTDGPGPVTLSELRLDTLTP
ncbi:hypothetical protein [Roseixanthobacter glucoisosaccharinicivorans]|uniref:hypothetical protein n=1 Tax=Roseixanthobacter glucoisosaccharinicivorans TaxID=3119923 RepID=UPI00372ABBD2